MSDLNDKSALREQARFHRDRIDPGSEDIEAAVTLFFDTIRPQKEQIVAAYWPYGKEFDVRYILDDLLRGGFSCALPVTGKDSRIMRFSRWTEDTKMHKSAFGVMEPVTDEETDWVDPDIVLVPLLAFDRRGHRLGNGGGHYDATLADLRARKEVLAVGIGYAQQAVLFNLPAGPHDQRLDWIITPKEARAFTESAPA